MPRQNSSQKTKWMQMRSCKRVDSRIPVLIEWAEEGRQRHVEGFTTDVGRQGCLIVARHDLRTDLRVRLTNQATHQSTDATVVWTDQAATGDTSELGVELLNPPPNFWGLEV